MKKLCLGKFVEKNNLKGGLLFGKTGIVRKRKGEPEEIRFSFLIMAFVFTRQELFGKM